VKRREFITVIGGAVAWPLAAHAQQAERMRRIGVFSTLSADDPEWQARLAAFHQGLQELGWIVGRNIRIEHRVGPGDEDYLRRRAAELVVLAPDAIVVNGTSPLTPLLQATRQVPVVFVNVSDPVGAGFVASLARPGGNATGFTQFEYGMSGKWLELLKQIAPGLKRAAVLRDARIPTGIAPLAVLFSVAPSLGWWLAPSTCATRARLNAVSRHSQAGPMGD
jgi:putative ABC transport system substrate-binding protein